MVSCEVCFIPDTSYDNNLKVHKKWRDTVVNRISKGEICKLYK